MNANASIVLCAVQYNMYSLNISVRESDNCDGCSSVRLTYKYMLVSVYMHSYTALVTLVVVVLTS